MCNYQVLTLQWMGNAPFIRDIDLLVSVRWGSLFEDAGGKTLATACSNELRPNWRSHLVTSGHISSVRQKPTIPGVRLNDLLSGRARIELMGNCLPSIAGLFLYMKGNQKSQLRGRKWIAY